MKLVLLSVFLFAFMSTAYALDCQYKDNEDYQELEWGLYTISGDYFGLPLEPKDFAGGSFNLYGCSPPSFKIYNTLGSDITLNISYTTEWTTAFGPRSQNHEATVTISQYSDSAPIIGSCIDIGSGSISEDSVKYSITSPELLILRNEQVSKTREICKICSNGKQCINDGEVCTYASECGGGYCVEGYCSTNWNCYQNNCKCPTGKIQCTDDKRCLERSVVEVGAKPKCGLPEECKTNFLDANTKTCAKSTSQIDLENWNKTQVIAEGNIKIIRNIAFVVIVIVLGIALFLYLKYKVEQGKQKTESEKQKTIEKQMQLIITRLEVKNRELEKLKKEIQEIKFHKKIKKEDLEFLEILKQKETIALLDLQKLREEINSMWKNLKPFPDPQANNRLVICNPYLGGYRCFYNEDLELENYPISSLVHRWVWKKHTGKDPKPRYHIHHKDGNKYNNDFDNLEEIQGEEHYAKHRKGRT